MVIIFARILWNDNKLAMLGSLWALQIRREDFIPALVIVMITTVVAQLGTIGFGEVFGCFVGMLVATIVSIGYVRRTGAVGGLRVHDHAVLHSHPGVARTTDIRGLDLGLLDPRRKQFFEPGGDHPGARLRDTARHHDHAGWGARYVGSGK